MWRLFAVLFLITNYSFAQDLYLDKEREVITYDTFEDYTSGNGVSQGIYASYYWDSWGGNAIYIKKDGERDRLRINPFWGFTIGDYLFRNKNGSPKIPVVVLGNKNRYFYMNGYLVFSSWRSEDGEGSSFRSEENLFYSNDLESKILDIESIIKKEKKTPALTRIVNCIKTAKKERHGIQPQFNSYLKCIEGFIKKRGKRSPPR